MMHNSDESDEKDNGIGYDNRKIKSLVSKEFQDSEQSQDDGDNDVYNASKSCYPLASVEFVIQLGMKLSFKRHLTSYKNLQMTGWFI